MDNEAVEAGISKEMNLEIFILFRILIFPGELFLLVLAFFFEWVDRRFYARLQNRYGPLHTGPFGILQPMADFIKLLSKEDIIPSTADRHTILLIPILYLALPLATLFIIPSASQTGTVAFEGDLVFILFTFTLVVVTIFLAGWGSANRFSALGSIRAALQMLSYEIPMGLVMIGPAIAAGSLSISRIVAWQSNNHWLLLLQPIGFAVLLICLLAELQFVPFDVPEAETEIVAGWRTEFTGRRLAMFRLGKNLELLLASALIVSLYLGGSHEFWLIPPIGIFLVKTTFVVMILSFLRALLLMGVMAW